MLSNTYPGSDTYIDGTRIWSCHPVLDEGFEFEVPAGKVFMLTYAARDIKRLSDNVWLGVSGIGTTQSAMPGIPLPPGRYQLYNDSADYLGVSGYVTTDN